MTEKPVVSAALQEKLRAVLPSLILASGSPNRRQLLQECGVTVIQKPQEIDEMCGLTEPKECVEELSRRKLESCLQREEATSLPIIAVDTLVYNEGKLIGKPVDVKEAGTMLKAFSGRCQQVWSGVSLHIDGVTLTQAACSLVFFRKLSGDEINAYLATGEWKGAAGGYRVQKTGYTLIDHISGSWSNVVGLPLELIVRAATALRSAPARV